MATSLPFFGTQKGKLVELELFRLGRNTLQQGDGGAQVRERGVHEPPGAGDVLRPDIRPELGDDGLAPQVLDDVAEDEGADDSRELGVEVAPRRVRVERGTGDASGGGACKRRRNGLDVDRRIPSLNATLRTANATGSS